MLALARPGAGNAGRQGAPNSVGVFWVDVLLYALHSVLRLGFILLLPCVTIQAQAFKICVRTEHVLYALVAAEECWDSPELSVAPEGWPLLFDGFLLRFLLCCIGVILVADPAMVSLGGICGLHF